MKHWEFLIQKEGDDDWLPLQEPGIAAGRYRMVAQTQRVNAEVEIRITYYGQITRSQKCRRWTNAEGLIAIFPFTDLQPGRWEIVCCGDLMDELMGETQQESLDLNVVSDTPASATTSNEEEYELVSVVEFEPDAALPTEDSEYSEALELLDLLQLEELEEAEEQQTPEFNTSDRLASEASDGDAPCSPLHSGFSLTLYQDTFIKGEPILLTGRVDCDGEASPHWQSVEGRLRYRLRDPRTGQVLFDAEQPLSNEVTLFSYTLELEPWETCLLLGEVSLEVASEQNKPLPVAGQSFTITANAEELLPASAFDVQKLRLHQSNSTVRHLSLFDPSRSRTNRSMKWRASSGQVLPPRISAQASSSIQEPQLPKFRVKLATAFSAAEYPYPAVVENNVAADETAIAADQAFQALNLQERFWSRLSSLTVTVDAIEEDTEAEAAHADEAVSVEAAAEATQMNATSELTPDEEQQET